MTYFKVTPVFLLTLSSLAFSAPPPGTVPLSPEQEVARALAHSIGLGSIDYDGLEQEKQINGDLDKLATDLVKSAPDSVSLALSAAYALGSPSHDEDLRALAHHALDDFRSKNEQAFKSMLASIPNSYTVSVTEDYLLHHDYNVTPLSRFYSAQTVAMLKARLNDPATTPYEQSMIRYHLSGAPASLTGWTSKLPADPFELYKFMIAMIDKLPPVIKDRDRLIGAVKFLQGMIFKDAAEQYPQQTTQANFGLINYYSDLSSDPKIAMTSALVLSQLRTAPTFPQAKMWDTTDVNVWQLALQATHGDRLSALRGLVTFGVDDCCNQLSPRYAKDPQHFAQETSLLNGLWAADRTKVLDRPGSLDGLNVAPALLDEYHALEARANAAGVPQYYTADALYPAYYHFYGGAAVAAELIAHGFDREGPIRIPVFLSELLGYFYKMVANETSYIKNNPDAAALYAAGYHKYKQPTPPPMPEGWTQSRYDQAIVMLDFSLLAVELNVDQHRKGAEWAFRMLSR